MHSQISEASSHNRAEILAHIADALFGIPLSLSSSQRPQPRPVSIPETVPRIPQVPRTRVQMPPGASSLLSETFRLPLPFFSGSTSSNPFITMRSIFNGGNGGNSGRSGSRGNGPGSIPDVDIDFFDLIGPGDIPQHGVVDSVIDSLPLKIIPKSERSELCPICHENFVNSKFAKSLPCGHTYHSQCINEWLSRSTKCAVCRHSLVSH